MASQAGWEPAPFPDRTPHALLDAGGESWERLGPLIARRVQELGAGEILEITTGHPGVRLALQAWCVGHGHVVLRSAEDGDQTLCWVKKGGTSDGSEH